MVRVGINGLMEASTLVIGLKVLLQEVDARIGLMVENTMGSGSTTKNMERGFILGLMEWLTKEIITRICGTDSERLSCRTVKDMKGNGQGDEDMEEERKGILMGESYRAYGRMVL